MRVQFTAGTGIDRHNKPIDPGEASAAIVRSQIEAAKRFGGVTVTRGLGLWRDPQGRIVSEPTVSFDVDFYAVEEQIEKQIESFATLLRAELRQASIHTTVWYDSTSTDL